MGPLMTISQSAHLYDDTWENVDQLLANQYNAIIQQRDFYDPSGNFLIELEADYIIVKQTTPGSGEIVAHYQGKNPLKLVREIAATSPATQGEHLGYLGIELQKAYTCLKNALPYSQDQ
jgi:thymidylate synthase